MREHRASDGYVGYGEASKAYPDRNAFGYQVSDTHRIGKSFDEVAPDLLYRSSMSMIVLFVGVFALVGYLLLLGTSSRATVEASENSTPASAHTR